jgi:hypothetical protein
MEVTQVDQYESDKDVIEKNDSTKGIKNVHTKKRTKFWTKDKTFDTASEAETLVGNGWSKHFSNYTDKGKRVYYRCKKARRHDAQCNASVSLLYHADSDQVTVYRTDGDHDHHETEIRGIDKNIKQCIERLYNDGITYFFTDKLSFLLTKVEFVTDQFSFFY